jgi:GNAT superfamily N-acetyltransferase
MPEVDYLTAETEEGRRAITEVANKAIPAALEIVPPEWAIVRRVHGEPVSFALIDPQRVMRFGRSGLRYAYINQIATHADRRSRGHFRATLEEAFRRLKQAGLPLVVLHGSYHLYRRFGFEVFTYHSGIFLTPELVERRLGIAAPESIGPASVDICESQLFSKDLLYITHAPGSSLEEARQSLIAAAALARQRNRARILIEHPDAPSFGSTYPIYPSLETPLTALARACGAWVVVQGANPEDSGVPNADWIKVLDPLRLAQAAVDFRIGDGFAGNQASLWIDTEAGSFGLRSDGSDVSVTDQRHADMEPVRWSSGALAQLATGFHSAGLTCVIQRTPLSDANLTLLETVFPAGWRLSRNMSWVTQHRPGPR